MNIALIHTQYLQRGGEAIAYEAEARLLEERGHTVHRYETSNQELLAFTSGRRALAAVWNVAAVRDLRRFLRARAPDIVHFHNTFPLLSPAVYRAVPAHSALVQTLHNYRLICPGGALLRDGAVCEVCVGKLPWAGIRHGCYRSSRSATTVVAAMVHLHRAAGTWKRVDRFIALTDFARTLFVRGGLPARSISVKPNFIDPDPGAGTQRAAHLLFVGRLDEQKGVRTLLDAWRDQAPAPLRIIGDGQLRPLVEACARENDAIVYLGAQPRATVLRELQEARALVFPSLSYESLPFTVLEAFAAGLPVLISDVANAAGLVEQGRTGWTFRAGTAPALRERAAALRGLALEPLNRAARSCFIERYSADANYDALCAIYRDARGVRRQVA